jgi:hypothetical protein
MIWGAEPVETLVCRYAEIPIISLASAKILLLVWPRYDRSEGRPPERSALTYSNKVAP